MPDWLCDRRLTPPEPDGTCPECGQEAPYCLFRCSRHIANEAEYRDAENGFACFICEWPKPDHHRSCYRAGDFTSASHYDPADYQEPNGWN